MGLLDFIQEHHGIRPPADRFGELASFFVTHVSWRRADQAAHRVLFHELAHVETDHGVFVVEQRLGESLAEFRFAHARGTTEQERANRTIGILQAAAAATNRVRDGCHRFVLPHHALMQALFENEELGPFGLHHARDGNPRPRAHDFGDFIGSDFLAQQTLAGAARRGFFASRLARFDFVQMFGELLTLDIEFVQRLVERFGNEFARGLLILDRRGELLGLVCDIQQFLADLLHVAHAEFFAFPLFAQVRQLLFDLVHVVVDFGETLLGMFFGFVGQLSGGNFQLRELALQLIDLGRYALEFHRQPAGGFIHQVDRLIRQEAIGNVTMRKLRGGHERRIFDPHTFMMGFVTGFQATQNRDGILHAGFAHEHGLEPPFKRGILFDVLAIFIKGRCTNATEFATRERGLE